MISMNLIRRAIALTAAAAMAALITLAVSACSVTVGYTPPNVTTAGGTQTYRAHGVSFDYPAGWQEEDLPASAGSGWLWRAQFSPGPGDDLINVEANRLSISVGAGNLAQASSELESLVRRSFAQKRGTMRAGPQQITVRRLPALRFQVTGTLQDGTVFGSTLLFVFNGTTEYEIDCQHTRANAGEVQRACGQVMRTFKVSKAA
jgi:hypothetical protein